MPPLAFGSLALLRVNLLHGRPGRLPRVLVGTAALLVPLGVGLFDWIENLAHLTAMNLDDELTTTVAIWIGLIAKWIKAAFLQATMLGTGVVLVYVAGLALRPRARRQSLRSSER